MMHGKTDIKPIFNQDGVCYVKSFLGIQIKILKVGWNNISKLKHPDLENKFHELVKILIQPTQIWQSKNDKQVFLYYFKINKKYFCAICKHYNHQGFLITAYYTYKPRGLKKTWTKQKK